MHSFTLPRCRALHDFAARAQAHFKAKKQEWEALLSMDDAPLFTVSLDNIKEQREALGLPPLDTKALDLARG